MLKNVRWAPLILWGFHGSQWGPNVWLPTFFKISYFCVHQKKEIHTGLE